ncbi:aspartate aminotransferase family protein, partial [Streptomyces lasiicapitis]
MSSPPPLAGGLQGPQALRPLLETALEALAEGAAERGGPLPRGGPAAVEARGREAAGELLPAHGAGADEALRAVVGAVAPGAGDPAVPLWAAHRHSPPLARGGAGVRAPVAPRP